MANTKYKLRYLPLFYKDLEEKIVYIAEELHNEKAANDLLDEVEAAILERQPVAESFEPYRSLRERRYPYYRIYVKNFGVIKQKKNSKFNSWLISCFFISIEWTRWFFSVFFLFKNIFKYFL